LQPILSIGVIESPLYPPYSAIALPNERSTDALKSDAGYNRMIAHRRRN